LCDWQGDTCVSASTFTLPKPGDDKNGLLLAVADGGVARTLDGGRTYQRASEEWAGTKSLHSEGTAIVTDRDSGCIYAAHYDRGSVISICDSIAECSEKELLDQLMH
jgi:hypothetical protein